MTSSVRTCPACRGEFTPLSQTQRFCSARCQWVDLGGWMDGRHAIAGDPIDPLYPDDWHETVLK